MKFLKSFYILSIAFSVLACSVTYADTCYDPNYNRYYECADDEYIAPVVAGILFGEIFSGDNNNWNGNNGHYNNGNHGGYRGGNVHGGGFNGGNRHGH